MIISTGAPRVPLIEMADAARLAAEIGMTANLADQPIWRALLHRPKIAQAIHRLVTLQIFKSSFDPRLRELAILRIAWRTDSAFEWTQHWRLAADLGLPAGDMIAVRDWQTSARFDERDRTVLAAADDVVDCGRITDHNWSALVQLLSLDQSIDAALAIATWAFISSLLRSLDVPLADHMEAWPPDGQAPPPMSSIDGAAASLAGGVGVSGA